jgi:hypothetical protein
MPNFGGGGHVAFWVDPITMLFTAVQCRMSALCQKRTQAPQQFYFDHQVGAAKQRQTYSKSERLRGFQIDDQFRLGGLLNWKIGWLFALEPVFSTRQPFGFI